MYIVQNQTLKQYIQYKVRYEFQRFTHRLFFDILYRIHQREQFVAIGTIHHMHMLQGAIIHHQTKSNIAKRTIVVCYDTIDNDIGTSPANIAE